MCKTNAGTCRYIFLILLLENPLTNPQSTSDRAYYKIEDEYNYAVPQQCSNSSAACEAVDFKQTRELKYKQRSRVMEAILKTQPLRLDQSADPDLLSFLRDRYDLPKGLKGPLAEYDFIIVGAGSAGSVLASRLSEDHKTTVLVIEAGRGESLFTGVPILAPFFQQTHYTWPYLMERQPGVCLGMENQRCFWPRGRAVGGSSVINYMIYTRGLPKDWDQIAADGNYGWSYNEVLPYYTRSERATLRSLKDSRWHGRAGELFVEDVPFRSKLSKAFLDAVKVMGHRVVDYNSPDGFGFNYIQATISNGRRHSAARAFLHPHKNRLNLHILPSSTATKVLIDPITREAKGIEFSRNRQSYRVYARKEVILSAGPIASPQMLMLSGVGPKKHLESLGISVVKDLPVGQVLYDHISFPALTFTLNTTRLTLMEKRVATVGNAIQFTQYGDGPMSSLAGVETIGYIKTNVSDRADQYPDIELIGSCASLASDEGNVVAKGIKMADWLYNDVFKPIENMDTFAILFMLLHPKSKGYMKLKSKNPFDHPKLYGNYMTHSHDVATMIAAIRYITKIIDTPPFRKYGAKLYKKKFPNCKEIKFDTDKYWECAVRTLTATLHHQIATCKMGPSDDDEAVVDPELRVYGVKRLRVVDSSVIPRTIAAHTNAPAIMIGEKAADMIRRAWGLK